MKVSYIQQFTYRHLPSDFSDRHSESVVTNPYYELVDPESVTSDFRSGLDEMMHAARAGFDAVAVTEHGSANYDMSPNPDLTAAAFAYASGVEGLEVGVQTLGRSLGKTREALRVAEEQAVLDCISGGRLLCGFPMGLAYDANINYGIPPIETRARYDENFELVLRAWTSRQPFAWNGRFSQHPAVNIWPRPVQSPHPPVSITGVGNPNTARFAIERDLGYNLVALGGDPMQRAKPVFDMLWRTAEELGADDNPYRATYAAFVVVADTDAQAEKLYADHVEYCFRNGIGNIPIHRLAMPGGISPEGLRALMSAGAAPDTGPPTYRQLAESGAVIAGSPATVRDRLTEYAKAFRIGNLLGFLQVGSMPHELTKHNIDLFSSEVLPHLRPLWSEYDDANRWWPVRLGGRPASDRQAADDGARLR